MFEQDQKQGRNSRAAGNALGIARLYLIAPRADTRPLAYLMVAAHHSRWLQQQSSRDTRL
jgi:hypothetical protein